MNNPNRPILVIANVITFEGKFLLGKSLQGDRAGKYIFPGGKVDNETVEQAFWRELKEECDLDAPTNASDRKLRFMGFVERQGGGTDRLLVMFFHAKYNPEMGKPVNLEPTKHSPWEWIPYPELETLDFYFTNREFVDANMSKFLDVAFEEF